VSSFHQGLIPIHCHVGRHDRQPTMPTMPRRLFVRSGVQWNFRNQQALLASVEMNGMVFGEEGLGVTKVNKKRCSSGSYKKNDIS